MKVGHPSDKPLPPAPASGPAAPAESATAKATVGLAPSVVTATPAQPDASAKVELSSTAATLLSGDSTAEFDAGKVASISQSIADGTFKVNADVIADKLIANARELLTKTQR
jgi:negative regulator of flagellin synthesis FlgM